MLLRWWMPVALGCAACSRPHSANDGEVPPTVVLRGVTVTEYHGAERTAVGRADRVAYLRGDSVLMAADAGFRMLGGPAAQGKARGLTVSAHQMEGNLSTRQMDAVGDVHLTTATGMTAVTDQATIDGSAMTVSGAAPVKVRSPQGRLQAQSFRLDLSNEDYEFDGGVTVDLGVP